MARERIRHTDLGDDFLWLADMQEGRTEPLYMDAVHYTAQFCEAIAVHISDFIA